MIKLKKANKSQMIRRYGSFQQLDRLLRVEEPSMSRTDRRKHTRFLITNRKEERKYRRLIPKAVQLMVNKFKKGKR